MCQWQPYSLVCQSCGRETRNWEQKAPCNTRQAQHHNTAFMNTQPRLPAIRVSESRPCGACGCARHREKKGEYQKRWKDKAARARAVPSATTKTYQANLHTNPHVVARQPAFVDEATTGQLPLDWHGPPQGPPRSFIDRNRPWTHEDPGRHPERYANVSEDSEDDEEDSDDDEERGRRRRRRRRQKDPRYSFDHILRRPWLLQ